MVKIERPRSENKWQCINCGSENSVDDAKCLVCNNQRETICPNCKSLIEPTIVMCPTCGVDIMKYYSAREDLITRFQIELDTDRAEWEISEAERAEREIESASANAKHRTAQVLMLFGAISVILIALFVVRQIREQEKQAMLSREYEAATNCLREYDYNCARDHFHYLLSVEPDYHDTKELLGVVYSSWSREAIRQGDVRLAFSLMIEHILSNEEKF